MTVWNKHDSKLHPLLPSINLSVSRYAFVVPAFSLPSKEVDEGGHSILPDVAILVNKV